MKRSTTNNLSHRSLLVELKRIQKEIQQLRSVQRQIPKLPARFLTEGAVSERYTNNIRLDCESKTIHFCEKHYQLLLQRGLQEECHLLTLDNTLSLIASHQLTIGLANRSELHPREVFRPAILDAAHAVILVHNHPSGDATPSKSDILVTKSLTSSGKLLGIPLIDHIILARSGSRSLAEHCSPSNNHD